MRQRLTRRRFLEISCLGAAGLATGCSSTGTYSPQKPNSPSEAPELSRFEEAVVSGGPGKDGIPSIDEPRFVSAEEMENLLEPEDRIFVLDYNGDLRVYPQKILVWHEIVNDVVAGENLSVTYCPLTGSTVAFKGRAPGGEPLTFGTTGKLVNSNLLMYDRQTNSEWPQILGRAISGDMRGTRLEEIPLVWITWKLWKERGSVEAPVLSAETGSVRSYGQDPYGSYSDLGRDPASDRQNYYYSPQIFFPVLAESKRLAPKEVVVGVKAGDARLAVPRWDILEKRVWNLELGDRVLVAVGDPALETAWIFDRRLEDETLEFEPGEEGSLIDQNDGTWRREGLKLEGPGGNELPAARFFEVMWFAWYAFFPDTRLATGR
jgi:hypothetical protein